MRHASSVDIEPNNSMAKISKLDRQVLSNLFHGNLLGSPIDYKYKNSSEQRNDVTNVFFKIFDFNGVNVAKHWHVAGRGI